MKIKVIIILALVLCCSCAEHTIIENDKLQEVISQVWLDVDLAQKTFGEVETNNLNEYEEQRYHLAKAHLMLKRELRLPNGSDMDALAKYFESCRDEASMAEAY